MNKFYLTTAIAYTSGRVHIGNTYEIVLADAIARYKKSMGYEVYFQTGTDEHGQKIEMKAQSQGLSPKEFVDGVASEIKANFDLMNVSYDKFVRTSDQVHYQSVGKIFEKLYQNGDIYLGKYQGLYCVACESFFTASQVVDNICPDSGDQLITQEEDAYFLKLSKYEEQLRELFKREDFIIPSSRKNEMINNFLDKGLTDLCVSRSSFNWGIPVTFAPGHVVYVWIDALSNYITFLGFDALSSKQPELFNKLWPADLHVIGKDILRFHSIYWPIILMALGQEMPKQILAHPWLLVNAKKMSKSKNNSIYAEDLLKFFSVDEIRYYLLSEMGINSDGNISWESVIEKVNADLANTLGNLLSRTVSMAKKYFDGKVNYDLNLDRALDREFKQEYQNLKEQFIQVMDRYETANAIELVINMLRKANKYIDDTMPWKLAKASESQAYLQNVLYHLLQSLKIAASLLEAFIPQSALTIFSQLALDPIMINNLTFDNTSFDLSGVENKILFQRLDSEKTLNLIEEYLNG